MGGIFKDYSKYYDLLYSDKLYEKEVNYIHGLIKKYLLQPAKSILNLGCGTGKHDIFLSEMGYNVTGIDISLEMLDVAQQSKKKNAHFLHGDLRTIRVNKIFDVVSSLFHVISYQTSDKDLQDAFLTAKSHLKPGGIFIFDCWYGPGVLNDLPAKRKKEVENAGLKIKRVSTPVMYPDQNMVEVQFDIEVVNKISGENFHLSENHKMRYLFLPELRKKLEAIGFDIVGEEEWLTGKKLGLDSWYACLIARIK